MGSSGFEPLRKIIKKKYTLDDILIEDGKTWLREDLEEIKKNNKDKIYALDEAYNIVKVIEAWNLNFHESKVIEHLHRACLEINKKNKTAELLEAKWYLDRLISISAKR